MDAAARKAFESTVLAQVDSLFGVAVRLTKSRAEAEDLVQETLVRAYRFWASFRPGSSVRAWLHNASAKRYARAGRFEHTGLCRNLRRKYGSLRYLSTVSPGLHNNKEFQYLY